MYPKTLNSLPKSIQKRAGIERRIVRILVSELLAHKGVTLAVYDGDEMHAQTTVKRVLYSQLLETDEDVLMVHVDGEHFGNIVLVYGNSGYDVMSDYHCCLESYMPVTLALAERLYTED